MSDIRIVVPGTTTVGVFPGTASAEIVGIPRGERGPPGPPGPAGAVGGAYRHVQDVASTIWTIQHGLGYHPNITTFNGAGDEFRGRVEHLDMMIATVTSSAANSGEAYAS